jgi:hypothetical protein
MEAPERDAARLDIGGQDLEPLRLLAVERKIFRKGHHRARDSDALPRREIANQFDCLQIRYTDAPEAGVYADMDRNGPPEPPTFALEHVTHRRVNHRHDVSRDGELHVALVQRRHQQDRFLDAGLPQIERLLEFHDGEAVDRRMRGERVRRMHDPKAIAVVLDHREHGPRRDPRHLPGVVTKIRCVNLNPRIEGRRP